MVKRYEVVSVNCSEMMIFELSMMTTSNSTDQTDSSMSPGKQLEPLGLKCAVTCNVSVIYFNIRFAQIDGRRR